MSSATRILLVDDTPENLDVLSGILEDLDCQLIVATSGERALELAAQSDRPAGAQGELAELAGGEPGGQAGAGGVDPGRRWPHPLFPERTARQEL